MSEVPLYVHLQLSKAFSRCVGCPLYRGTSLSRNRRPVGPYSRTMSRALWGS